jgi:hypothetical protein
MNWPSFAAGMLAGWTWIVVGVAVGIPLGKLIRGPR